MAREMLRVLAILGWPCFVHAQGPTSPEPHFEVSLGPGLGKDNYTSRLYVFLSRRTDLEPRKPLRFLSAEPILAKDVSNLRPGHSISFSLSDLKVLRFPRDLKEKDLVGMRAQAIVRLSEFDPDVNNGEGNGYSDVVTFESTSLMGTRLTVDRVIPKYEFPKTGRRREFTVHSHILCKFYGDDVFLNAAVIVPENYDSIDKHYPVVFHIPGFGGSYHYGEPLSNQNSLGVEFLHVMLNGCYPFGHHAFADSANCGLYQKTFIEEFLPVFEEAYPTVAERRGRFLAGHSSDGWSNLCLQINHPQTFAGAWCYSPNPVDFLVFQNIDMYREGENRFRDERGNRRPFNQQSDGKILI